MAKVEFITPPGAGEYLLKEFGFSQIVKIGDRLEFSGQGGWRADFSFPSNLDEEYTQAFDNVEGLLTAVGASWSSVIHVNSYHLPTDDDGGITRGVALTSRLMRERMRHAPIWTCLGVPALGDKSMRVEVRVTAVLP
jgi:enamine deaminase RidA (YjgF/YER057c/UK114 family)